MRLFWGHSAGRAEEASDAELLGRIRAGERDCFGVLYGRYIPLLYGVCLKYLRDADRAEDAVMALFERLQPRMERYAIGEFRTWIYSAAKNLCLEELRRAGREVPLDSSLRFMESLPVVHLLEEGEASPRIEALKRCMEHLPEVQRVALERFFRDELSYADIAEATGWNLKSVKSYIQNGKRNLKICIEKRTERWD